MRRCGPWLVGLLTLTAAWAADDPEATYRQARDAFQAGTLAVAAELFADLAHRYPDNADYLLGHGQVLLAQGRATDAVDVLERALVLAPTYADVALVLANARRAQQAALAEDAAARAGLDQARQQPLGGGRTTVSLGFESTLTA